MCDVMPTILEDDCGHASLDDYLSEDSNNLEQVVENMLEEKEKFLENLNNAHDEIAHLKSAAEELRRERDLLHQRLFCGQTQVSTVPISVHIWVIPDDVPIWFYLNFIFDCIESRADYTCLDFFLSSFNVFTLRFVVYGTYHLKLNVKLCYHFMWPLLGIWICILLKCLTLHK